ncbi:MAG: hypothetical protein LH477_18035 [Nocardioides sp.]|nr:hypothetical protein [Nocardioides sp.]
MPEGAAEPDLHAAEEWFVDHGLPYFVDDIRSGVRARLSRPRVTAVTAASLVLAAAVGGRVGWTSGTVSGGLTAGLSTVIVVWIAYAARALKVWMIARWALRRTFASLGLLFPLATRALPMLLLFVTFLFINTEVWQVASSLDGGVLWVPSCSSRWSRSDSWSCGSTRSSTSSTTTSPPTRSSTTAPTPRSRPGPHMLPRVTT